MGLDVKKYTFEYPLGKKIIMKFRKYLELKAKNTLYFNTQRMRFAKQQLASK